MKKKLFHKSCFFLFFILIATGIQAQDSVAKESVLSIKYFSVDNKIPYLVVQSQSKLGKKYTPVKNVPVQVFIDSDSSEANLLSKVTTGENGEAKVILPASVKELWGASAQHNFIATAAATKEFEETKTELPVIKSKIIIDTSTDETAKNITVTVTQLKDGEWVPANDVEMKIGIRRFGSILSAGDEETYTTDSTGQAVAEFKKDSLPGDEKENIMLVAKVEDNELYGNLVVEKSVPWGVYKKFENNFNKRSLWATGFKTPLWLLFMAYSIVAGVWSVILYLVWQIIKIKKLGGASA
jgi:ribosomal protein L7Ae-like RNA K-turn-binding protein